MAHFCRPRGFGRVLSHCRTSSSLKCAQAPCRVSLCACESELWRSHFAKPSLQVGGLTFGETYVHVCFLFAVCCMSMSRFRCEHNVSSQILTSCFRFRVFLPCNPYFLHHVFWRSRCGRGRALAKYANRVPWPLVFMLSYFFVQSSQRSFAVLSLYVITTPCKFLRSVLCVYTR